MTCVRQPRAHPSAPRPWPRTLSASPPSSPILPVSSPPTGLSQLLTLTARSSAPLPSVRLVPLPSPSNLFAVCGHEVEAAGGNGESDGHSGELQVTPPQNGAERAATGLRKGPRSRKLGIPNPETPMLLSSGFLPTSHTCLRLPLHRSQQHPEPHRPQVPSSSLLLP